VKRSLAIACGVLGLVALISTGVLLFYVTDLAPIQALLLAFVALLGAFVTLLVITLVSNTRRPAGIDPNAPPRRVDPFGATTDELRGAVLLPDSRPYGRRISDDRHVVERLIDRLEKDDSARPPPVTTPQWALDLQQTNGDATPLEEP